MPLEDIEQRLINKGLATEDDAEPSSELLGFTKHAIEEFGG